MNYLLMINRSLPTQWFSHDESLIIHWRIGLNLIFWVPQVVVSSELAYYSIQFPAFPLFGHAAFIVMGFPHLLEWRPVIGKLYHQLGIWLLGVMAMWQDREYSLRYPTPPGWSGRHKIASVTFDTFTQKLQTQIRLQTQVMEMAALPNKSQDQQVLEKTGRQVGRLLSARPPARPK